MPKKEEKEESGDEGCSGFFGCAWEGAKDTFSGAVSLVRHPGQIVDAAKAIASDPLGVAKNIASEGLSDIWSAGKSAMSGDFGGVGRMWGRWQTGKAVLDVARRGSRASKSGHVAKLKGGPEFGDLKTHAKKHGLPGQSADAYYNAAVEHARTAPAFRFRHDGKQKVGHVTRTGSNSFTFTSTTPSGKRVYTHIYGVNEAYLQNIGITLPTDF